MIFTVDTYKENGKKYVYVSADDGASGGKYAYNTKNELGEAVAFYIDTYYPSEV